ncbi:MAG TPA: hypothetical protein VJH21_02125 [Candidatus Paceibacterota bacterium]
MRFFFATFLIFVVPAVAVGAGSTFRSFVNDLVNFFNTALVPFIFAISLLVFLWGIFQYVIYPSEEKKTEGKQIILWGLISFFVMLSVWGIVNLVHSSLFPISFTGGASSLPNLMK